MRRLKCVDCWIPAAIGAVGAIAGGALSSGLFGGSSGMRADDQIHYATLAEERQTALQKEFAQNSLRWRVEDAKRAKIHPLAALGATGSSYTPTAHVGVNPQQQNDYSWLADASQHIAGAMGRGLTEEEKKLSALNIKNATIDSNIKSAELEHLQIANAKAANELLMGSQSIPNPNGSNQGLTGQQSPKTPYMFIKAIDKNGNVQIIPNPELSLDETDYLFSPVNTVYQLGQDIKHIFKPWLKKRSNVKATKAQKFQMNYQGP